MAKITKRNGRGIGRLFKASQCSYKGLIAAWRTEDAFRQESIIALLLVVLSFLIANSIQHWISLVGSLILVLIVELLNSSIENACDRITLSDDEFIANAKDMGSAAVTLSILLATLVWLGSIAQLVIN